MSPRQSGAGEHGTQDEAGRTEPTQLGEKKAEGDLTAVYNYLTERHQKDRARLFSKEHSDGKKMQKTQVETWDIPVTYGRKKNYQGAGQTLAQAAQRRCVFSIFGDVQHSPGCSPEQHGLVRPF